LIRPIKKWKSKKKNRIEKKVVGANTEATEASATGASAATHDYLLLFFFYHQPIRKFM